MEDLFFLHGPSGKETNDELKFSSSSTDELSVSVSSSFFDISFLFVFSVSFDDIAVTPDGLGCNFSLSSES